ncbi:hypothetical protein F4802DRAFT_146293 [Xylaria palmicola]|nr:hypothetical protein F4802DRAFT_146293 [Xylaria palmicola]
METRRMEEDGRKRSRTGGHRESNGRRQKRPRITRQTDDGQAGLELRQGRVPVGPSLFAKLGSSFVLLAGRLETGDLRRAGATSSDARCRRGEDGGFVWLWGRLKKGSGAALAGRLAVGIYGIYGNDGIYPRNQQEQEQGQAAATAQSEGDKGSPGAVRCFAQSIDCSARVTQIRPDATPEARQLSVSEKVPSGSSNVRR